MTQVTAASGSAERGTVHPLVERITRMRGRVRAVIGLFGIGVVAASAVGAMLLLMTGDYLFHINHASARLVLLITWVAALGVLAWRVLIRPLSTRLTDQFLASRVENMHKELSDELISAVEFIHAGTMRTNALAARHVDAAAKKTASMRFEEAVDFRRSSKALVVAAFVIVVAAILLGMNRELGAIAMSRWFTASPLDWPRTTRVAFVWADGKAPAVIPIGEQLVVRVKVTQGGSAGQRVWLTTWGDNESPRSDLMTYQQAMSSSKEFVYERTVEPKGERTFSLKAEAGDDTEQSPVDIRLAARPVISDLVAVITPPAYVRDVKDPSKAAAAVTTDLLTQKGRAVEGSQVTVQIRATKAFMRDGTGAPVVSLLSQVKDAEVMAGMSRRFVEPMLAEVSFEAMPSWDARVVMRDTDGFENHAGATASLVVVPDGMPSVVITEPRRQADRSPTAILNVGIQGTDDLGLDGVRLVAKKFDAKDEDTPVFEKDLSWAEKSVDPASGNTSGRAAYVWDLAPLNLQPGARLTFYAMVQDNYNVNGKRHDWVKSAALTLQILSDVQIASNARAQLNDVKERIKALKTEQETTRDQTDLLQKAAAETGVTTAQQKEQLAQLSQQESQEAATANSIQQKLEQIKNEMAQNKISDSDLGKLAGDVSEGMKDVGQNNMPKAASELNKAHDSAGNQDPRESKQDEQSKAQAKQTADSAKNASKQQGEAIVKMNSMINELGAAGDLAAAKEALKKAIARQEETKKQTDNIGARTVGKKTDQLSKNEKDELNRLAKDQKEQEQGTQDLISQLEKAANQSQQNDPAGSQSMAKAAEAGKESKAAENQGSAAEQISKNQTSSALDSQGKAQAGLQQMLDELNKNEKRELESLQRQLTELIDEVKGLKKSEEELNTNTIAATAKATAAVLSKLGDQQGQLEMNTIVVQKKAENTKDAQEASVDIRDSAEQMNFAAISLMKVAQAGAAPETKAIALLGDAIEKLEKQKEKVEEELKKNDLADFIKKYDGIRTDQKKIKTGSDDIEAKRQASEDKEIDRDSQDVLHDFAKTQGGLIEQIGKLSADEKLKEYDVILWMNKQISQAMTVSKDDMAKDQTGRPLAAAQQTAIDRITDIIDALKEEKNKDPFDKGEAQSPSKGSGSGQKKPLLPPMAQLKLVKAMQNVVNAETVSVNKAIEAAGSDAEKGQLKSEAAKIGETQGELKGVVKKIIDEMH